MLSIICEAFGCTPDIAAKQDWPLVRRILEYRGLQSAKEQHNIDVTKMSEGQVRLWKEMMEAVNSGDGS